MSCLEASDPGAELDRRTAGNPALRHSAWQVMQQVLRLERADPAVIKRDGEPAWPVIPGHVLEALVGRGGQGVVYRARQVYLDRKVAVKVLVPELRSTLSAERFRREARTLASLTHLHIVTCLHAGLTDDGDCYLVMEFVEGPNLRHWLDGNGRLPLARALDLAIAVAQALAHAHQHGIVHRDVKPENVLLQRRVKAAADDPFPFVPQLADLGLSRPLQIDQRLTMLTPAGAILGSPLTMAPEQFDAPDTVDLRADIYGLGCVLYHALAGRSAFDPAPLTNLMVQKAARIGPDVRRHASDIPAAVAALVQRMLARDPAERPPDYDALIRELSALRSERLAPAARAARWRIGFGAAITVAAVALSWRLLLSPAGSDSISPSLIVTAPSSVVEGSEGVLTAYANGTAVAQWRWTQTDGPPVTVLGADGPECRFVAPRGAPDARVTFEVAAVDAGTPLRRSVVLVIAPDPLATALVPGTKRRLFPATGEEIMPLWTTTAQNRWLREDSGQGVVVNSPRDRTEATMVLPHGPWVLRGRIDPRFRWVSDQEPRVRVLTAGCCLQFPGGDRLDLTIEPIADVSERLRAVLRRQRQDAAGQWHSVADIGSCHGEWTTADPLRFALHWTGDRLSCEFGAVLAAAPAVTKVVAPAADWQQPWSPGTATIYADRGVAAFTEWLLTAVN